MTKDMLITKISEKAEITKKDTRAVIEALAEVVMETLREDKNEKITIAPLGSFQTKFVAGREGVSRMGGAEKPWKTEDHSEITFKMSKSVKTI